jgi:hypothetical protein
MKNRLSRIICAALALVAVTAGISYTVYQENEPSQKSNAVLVMAQFN